MHAHLAEERERRKAPAQQHTRPNKRRDSIKPPWRGKKKAPLEVKGARAEISSIDLIGYDQSGGVESMLRRCFVLSRKHWATQW